MIKRKLQKMRQLEAKQMSVHSSRDEYFAALVKRSLRIQYSYIQMGGRKQICIDIVRFLSVRYRSFAYIRQSRAYTAYKYDYLLRVLICCFY